MPPVDVNKMSACALNPRGNLWMKDEKKYGLKILSKMGWQEGKGLGKNEDGISECIKVQKRNKNSGIGWVDKVPLGIDSAEYDAILARLNKVHPQYSESKNFTVVESIEKRSQQFKNRIHYRKYVRGKDVLRYSDKDMNSIFLSKKRRKTQPYGSEDAEDETDTSSNDSNKKEITKSVPTFQSKLNMNDYFAVKMKKLKFGQTNSSRVEKIPNSTDVYTKEHSSGEEAVEKLSIKQEELSEQEEELSLKKNLSEEEEESGEREELSEQEEGRNSKTKESIVEEAEPSKEREEPQCTTSFYDSWRETQRVAMKMKVYKSMRKLLNEHPLLKKTNVWNIKGYGNWGL